MIIKKAYKVRLYPNKAQEAELLRILTGCRFIWNYFLEKRQTAYLNGEKSASRNELSHEIAHLRKVRPELMGVQALPLHQALRRLEVAYRRFFRKVGNLPRLKTELDAGQSFQKQMNWRLTEDKISIQQNLVVKTRGRLPVNPLKLGTLVVKYQAGQWFASIFVQEEIKAPQTLSAPIGVDVGLTNLAVTSDGRKFETRKPGYDLHYRMRVLKKKLARQQAGSKRWEKIRKMIARLHLRMANIRENHLHQTSHAILANNPSMIAIESLNHLGMRKNRKLARSLADVSLGELHRQLKYKQVWQGGRVVEIDRFFPSTKTCSECGKINENMTLATRNWTCLGCGAEHDRDINAAKNLLRQGQGMPSVEAARA